MSQKANKRIGNNAINGKSELTDDERLELFNKLIKPNFDLIKSLCTYYTNKVQDVDENYNTVLYDFYRYIHTYNPQKSLKTWIHIVVRNSTWKANKMRAKDSSMISDTKFVSVDDVDSIDDASDIDLSLRFFTDKISDEVYDALLKLPTLKLSAFLLHLQGYADEEIARIEYRKGRLSKMSISIVKNRIWTARVQLKKLLNSYVKYGS